MVCDEGNERSSKKRKAKKTPKVKNGKETRGRKPIPIEPKISVTGLTGQKKKEAEGHNQKMTQRQYRRRQKEKEEKGEGNV
jgi:hypothetical protein